jgi:chitin disaccharide deacetylase
MKLIATADDVGLEPGMTEGAIRAHREGIITACSLVANGRAFDDAVARLRDTPSLEVGVHLTLVEERPLTAIRVPNKYTSFVPLYLVRAIGIDAIEKELRAQIEKVLATGLKVTHLNGHQHLHLLPRIFRVVARLAGEYGIGYVRIVDDGAPASRRLSARRPAAAPRAIAIGVLSMLGRRARIGKLTNDHTIGVADAGHLEDIVPLLDHVQGVTELVTHPGVGVRGYGHWQYDWDAETRALCDPRLRERLTQRGIELVGPSRV